MKTKIYGKMPRTKIILLTIAFFLAIPCINVSGAEFPDESSTGLDFSEMSNVTELHRGEIYKNYFTVTNVSDYPITFKVEIVPFSIIDNEGGVSLQVNTSETEITKWTQIFWDKEVTLEPGEERKISYIIDVPEDCKLGEQKEAIMVNALTPNKYGLMNGNGYLIYANVVDPPLPLPAIIAICLIAVFLIGIGIIMILVKKRGRKSTKGKKKRKSK